MSRGFKLEDVKLGEDYELSGRYGRYFDYNVDRADRRVTALEIVTVKKQVRSRYSVRRGSSRQMRQVKVRTQDGRELTVEAGELYQRWAETEAELAIEREVNALADQLVERLGTAVSIRPDSWRGRVVVDLNPDQARTLIDLIEAGRWWREGVRSVRETEERARQWAEQVDRSRTLQAGYCSECGAYLERSPKGAVLDASMEGGTHHHPVPWILLEEPRPKA